MPLPNVAPLTIEGMLEYVQEAQHVLENRLSNFPIDGNLETETERLLWADRRRLIPMVSHLCTMVVRLSARVLVLERRTAR